MTTDYEGGFTENWTRPGGSGTASLSNAAGVIDLVFTGNDSDSLSGTMDIEFDVPDFGAGTTALAWIVEILSFTSTGGFKPSSFTISAAGSYQSSILGLVDNALYLLDPTATPDHPKAAWIGDFVPGDKVTVSTSLPFGTLSFSTGVFLPSGAEGGTFDLHAQFRIMALAPECGCPPKVPEPTTGLLLGSVLAGGIALRFVARRPDAPR